MFKYQMPSHNITVDNEKLFTQFEGARTNFNAISLSSQDNNQDVTKHPQFNEVVYLVKMLFTEVHLITNNFDVLQDTWFEIFSSVAIRMPFLDLAKLHRKIKTKVYAILPAEKGDKDLPDFLHSLDFGGVAYEGTERTPKGFVPAEFETYVHNPLSDTEENNKDGIERLEERHRGFPHGRTRHRVVDAKLFEYLKSQGITNIFTPAT